MSMNEKEDKREYARLYYHYLTSYRIVDEKFVKQGVGITENLSLGGMMVSLKEKIELGTVLEIDIATKDAIITATTKVCHIAELGDGSYDIGMVFLEITEKNLEQLKKQILHD